MRYIKYIFLTIFLIGCLKVEGQNGWVRNAKGFYAQTSLSTFSSKDFYSTEGNLFDSGSTFNSRALLLYGEYGLTDRFTAVLDLPILMLNNFNTTETVGGVGNVNVGVKYGLFKSLPITLQIEVEIPTDDGINLSTAKEPNSLGTFDEINLPTSDGEINFWTTLAASHSFKNGKTFGSVFARFNLRSQSFSNQLQSGLEFGHLFFDKLYLIGKLKIQERLSSEISPGASFLYGEGTTFTSYGVTSMFKLDDKWMLVAGFTDFANFISARRNIYDGFTFSLGVAMEVK